MNEFENLVNYLLNKPQYLIWFFIFLGIINLSHLISAYKNIKSFLIGIFKKKENHIFIFNWETTTYEVLLFSKKLDVVKINATTHFFGVGSEHKWIQKYYKNAEKISQAITEIEIDNWKILYFDILTIKVRNIKKEIYFDISSFFNEHWSSETEWDHFVSNKIKELYNTLS